MSTIQLYTTVPYGCLAQESQERNLIPIKRERPLLDTSLTTRVFQVAQSGLLYSEDTQTTRKSDAVTFSPLEIVRPRKKRQKLEEQPKFLFSTGSKKSRLDLLSFELIGMIFSYLKPIRSICILQSLNKVYQSTLKSMEYRYYFQDQVQHDHPIKKHFNFKNIVFPKKSITKQWLRHLENYGVKNLFFNASNLLLDDDLKYLKGLPLQHLNLGLCPSLTDTGLAHLSSLPLQNLNLWGNLKYTDAGLAYLARMPLESLDLGWCLNITNTGLAHLTHMPLKYLNLCECDKITDAGLAHLAQLPLEQLDLSGCFNITDTGLVHLTRMPLRYLNIKACELITTRGIARIRSVIPLLEILR